MFDFYSLYIVMNNKNNYNIVLIIDLAYYLLLYTLIFKNDTECILNEKRVKVKYGLNLLTYL